jgi:GH24 family phage-related lysozyme (muramidase)
MENNIRNAYKQLVKESILNVISEGAVDEVTRAARVEHAKKAHESIMSALDADKIVTIRARKQPRFEDPAVDVNLIKHQGTLMLVDPRGVGKPIHTMTAGDSGHITVHFKEKGGRASKPLHLHAGHGAIGDMIETEKDASPYRVSLTGGKMQFKGLPDLSENHNYCYECELQQKLEEALLKKKVSPIKTALAGAAAGAIALGAGALFGKQQSLQAPVKTAVTQAMQKVGSGQVKSSVATTPAQTRSAHEMAARVIREREGFKPSAYLAPEGKWTIGYGNTTWSSGKPVKQGDTITRDVAEKEFEHHVKNKVVPHLEKLPHWGKMSEHQKAGLMSFAYNAGEYFHKSPGYKTITAAINDPEKWNEVPAAMALYNKATNPKTGKKETLPGLVTRRKYEGELWSGKEPELK